MNTPLLIFDGRCGFCRIWVDYWKQITGSRVAFAPSEQVGSEYPQIPPAEFAKSVQLVRPDGSVASGARAVFETLDKAWIYKSIPGVATLTEWAYRLIATHRDLFYQVTRFTFGRRVERDRFALTQKIFLKLLAMIYMIAFASLAVQVRGLIGDHGIAPARTFFREIAEGLGPSRYFAIPSLFWFFPGDGALVAGCWMGVAFAVVLAIGYFERVMLAFLYLLYLSYSLAGQIFMGYQWDALLLEAGFLAIFFGKAYRQQKIVAWLFRLLVFRLYFLSGWVKIASGDPNWRHFTALRFHYYTQPLPTILAWYADKLPSWFQTFSTAAVLGIELFAPFLVFAPRCWRHVGAWTLLALQSAIFLTGNYTFFNLLSMALTIFLFDDRALERLGGWRAVAQPDGPVADRRGSRRLSMAGTWLAILLTALGGMRIYESTAGDLPRLFALPLNLISQFQFVNYYGLFAVMTTSRPEIVIEGSRDGEHWQAYEFRYKPGDLQHAPRWAAPHQPRLDWQMWFEALGGGNNVSPWFTSFLERLLRGQPEVIALLEKDPFPQPPRYIRARRYEYFFTTREQRAATGEWWRREERGLFFPAVSLR